jgi:hypothetical protein
MNQNLPTKKMPNFLCDSKRIYVYHFVITATVVLGDRKLGFQDHFVLPTLSAVNVISRFTNFSVSKLTKFQTIPSLPP